ncbi:hypothetical protein WDU94_013352 [Cyamophila willieti]
MKSYPTSFPVIFFLATLCVVQISSQCSEDSLISYRLTVNTFWSQQAFPKHFPDTRPVAQWSKLYGISHQNNLTLFQVGTLANKSLQQFAEFGKTDEFESSLNHSFVLSQFYAPPIRRGVGVTSTKFLVNGEHSKVSFVMKIHPSPDWFIGVDRLDLCQNGTWIVNRTIIATPMDAGTDEGFTFTAPDYANEVPEPVYTINSTFPREPYSSFYYKNLTILPTMAEFIITKEQEYVKKPEKSSHNIRSCPENEAVAAIQNITTTLFMPLTREMDTNKTVLGNPSTNTSSVLKLQNIIQHIELNNNSTETLNRTNTETSSEFQVRKRRKRKNRKHMKSVVQMLKEILNNEQTSESESKDKGSKQNRSKEIGGEKEIKRNKVKENDQKQTVSKQTNSAKSKNKTTKQNNTQRNKKRHEQSKHQKELDLLIQN